MPKSGDDKDRFIPNGPLYPPDEVLKILESCPAPVTLSTKKCIRDTRDDGLDSNDVKTYIQKALKAGRFKNSEWCELKPGGPWAACDSYVITVSYWNEFAHKELEVEYYLKFAIGKNGNIILTISCHR